MHIAELIAEERTEWEIQSPRQSYVIVASYQFQGAQTLEFVKVDQQCYEKQVALLNMLVADWWQRLLWWAQDFQPQQFQPGQGL